MRSGLLLVALGIAIAASAWQLGFPWLVLLGWFAASFVAVGVAHVANWPRVFGKKTDGNLAGPMPWLLLPFMFFASATWSAIARLSSEAAWNQLRPDLRIGRRPRRQELADVDLVVDLTAEFPRTPGTHDYLALPILDTAVPDAEALARVLEQVPAGRTVLIHCAQGHGRTAMFAGCLLMHREGLPVNVALETVRAARPAARVNGRQLRFAAAFAAAQTESTARRAARESR